MPKMLPVNMSVEGVHVAAGLPSSHQMPVVPSADELDNWTQENYSLSVSAAANLGFPVGNVEGSVQHDALMFGAARWKDVVSGEHSYRFGVALTGARCGVRHQGERRSDAPGRCREGGTRGRPGLGSADGTWLRRQ